MNMDNGYRCLVSIVNKWLIKVKILYFGYNVYNSERVNRWQIKLQILFEEVKASCQALQDFTATEDTQLIWSHLWTADRPEWNLVVL